MYYRRHQHPKTIAKKRRLARNIIVCCRARQAVINDIPIYIYSRPCNVSCTSNDMSQSYLFWCFPVICCQESIQQHFQIQSSIIFTMLVFFKDHGCPRNCFFPSFFLYRFLRTIFLHQSHRLLAQSLRTFCLPQLIPIFIEFYYGFLEHNLPLHRYVHPQ